MSYKFLFEKYGADIEASWDSLTDEEKEFYLCDGNYIEGEDD